MRYLKRVTKNQYLKFRNKKGYTKYRTGRQFIVEVYSKKTHKRVGVLNKKDKKTKKLLPRRFSSFQLKFKTTQQKSRRRAKPKGEYSFDIDSKSPIIDQMKKHKRPIMALIRSRLRSRSQASVAVDVKPEGEPMIRSMETVITRGMTTNDILKILLLKNILDCLWSAKLRMSPKKLSKHKTYRHRPRARVTIFILEI